MSTARAFEGIVDIHVHADPDKTARALDVLEVARLYRDRGFRGMVIMTHFDPTAGLAYLVRKHVPGLEVYGGIVLNRLVGGINPAAVEHFVRIEGGYGRIVYMPTLDAENEMRRNGPSSPFVRISQDGRLTPEVLDMLDLIAKLGLVLSTGHSSPEEVLLLTEAAKERRVREVLITNPMFPSVDMGVEQMREAA